MDVDTTGVEPAATISLRRRLLGWTVRLAGLAVLPLLLVFGVNFGDVWRSLRDARIGWMIIALVLLEASLLLRTWRWRRIAEALGVRYPRFRDYALLFYAGAFLGIAVPQTAASFAPVALMTADGHPWRRAVGSIVLDRLVEGLATAAFAVIAALYLIPTLPQLSFAVLGVSAGVAVAAGALMLAYRRRRALPSRLESLLHSLPAFHPSPGLGGSLAALSVGVVAVEAAVAACAGRSVGLETSPLFIGVTWSLVALVVSLPISLLGLGPREGLLVLILDAAGEPREAAVALGFLLFALGLIARAPGLAAWIYRPASRAAQPAAAGGSAD